MDVVFQTRGLMLRERASKLEQQQRECLPKLRVIYLQENRPLNKDRNSPNIVCRPAFKAEALEPWDKGRKHA